jgi:hypothetical protein
MLTDNAIGGYFELELPRSGELYPDFYRFNLARRAIAAFFKARNIDCVHVPGYICNSVTDALEAADIEMRSYAIRDIQNIQLPKIERNEGLLIVNYFDLHDQFDLSEYSAPENVLIDNSQAFFNSANENIVYSPRKFFGVPDGAYLKTTQEIVDFYSLNRFNPKECMGPLIERIEHGAETGYPLFQQLHELYDKAPLEQMSNLSKRILESLNYALIERQRLDNFLFLHEKLGSINELSFNRTGRFCYPLMIKDAGAVRERLAQHRIYVPTYWPSVRLNRSADEYDLRLVNDLLPLPIDQRYTIREMEFIVSKILE